MFSVVGLALLIATQSTAIATVLPDTPQGRQLSAFIQAFNAGEAAFVAMYEVATIPAMAAQMPPVRRIELHKQLVRDVSKLKIEKLLSVSTKSVSFSMRLPEKGATATFTFTFEETTPYRISSVDMVVSSH